MKRWIPYWKGQPCPGQNQLNAFINQVMAGIRSGRLTEAQGTELIETAKQVILAIEGDG